MTDAEYIKKLERRIHNQRVRLRQLEKFEYEQLRSIWAQIYLNWRSANRAAYIGAARRLSRPTHG